MDTLTPSTTTPHASGQSAPPGNEEAVPFDEAHQRQLFEDVQNPGGLRWRKRLPTHSTAADNGVQSVGRVAVYPNGRTNVYTPESISIPTPHAAAMLVSSAAPPADAKCMHCMRKNETRAPDTL